MQKNTVVKYTKCCCTINDSQATALLFKTFDVECIQNNSVAHLFGTIAFFIVALCIRTNKIQDRKNICPLSQRGDSNVCADLRKNSRLKRVPQ